MRMDSRKFQTLPRSTATANWLSESSTGKSGASQALCAMHGHYPLYEYPFVVKVSAGSPISTTTERAWARYVEPRIAGADCQSTMSFGESSPVSIERRQNGPYSLSRGGNSKSSGSQYAL